MHSTEKHLNILQFVFSVFEEDLTIMASLIEGNCVLDNSISTRKEVPYVGHASYQLRIAEKKSLKED